MRRMEHVADALRAFLKSAGLDRGVARWRVVVEWRRIVGDEIADHAHAFRYRRGVVWVAVPNSSWMQHITYLKPKILAALRRELPQARVSDLHCIVRRDRDADRGERPAG